MDLILIDERIKEVRIHLLQPEIDDRVVTSQDLAFAVER
jgi:hypothetical protein